MLDFLLKYLFKGNNQLTFFVRKENEINFTNGIRILKSGNNKIFFEYIADNEFHEKTVNDIIELMKEKEENHE